MAHFASRTRLASPALLANNARFAPHAAVNAGRYMIVPCEADGCGDLAVIWDRLEEQVVDVISAAASARYSDEDALWDEARGFNDQPQYRMAA